MLKYKDGQLIEVEEDDNPFFRHKPGKLSQMTADYMNRHKNDPPLFGVDEVYDLLWTIIDDNDPRQAVVVGIFAGLALAENGEI